MSNTESRMTNETAVHPFRRFLRYATPYRSRIAIAALWSLLNKLFDLAPPLLIGFTVDILVRQESSYLAELGITDVWQQLLFMAFLTAVIWAGESIFEYFLNLGWRNLAQVIQHEMRMEAYEHVQNLEMGYFEDQSTGGLMSVLNDDVNQLERFLDRGANEIIQLMVTMVTIGLWFIAVAPSVAWMAILPMPVIVFGSIRFQRRLEPLYQQVRDKVGILNGQLSNNLGGIATIKSFATEEYEIGRIHTLSDQYRQANSDAIRFSASFVPLIRMAIMAGFIAILLGGGRLVLQGNLNVGLYSTLVYITQRLLWPLTRLGETLDLYQRAMASVARIFSVLDKQPDIISGETPLPAPKGAVTFENVTFAYSNGMPVVRDVSLTIPAGKTVAFVGATGSGKTTLTKLLLRFYDAVEGGIKIDGVDVRKLDIHDLHRAIGLVSQDVYLFHGTARSNIAYGTFDASDDDIFEAARIAEAHDFITKLPDAYDTIVGERGQKLSGGQRQRLSIARAVLKDPPILILDEATSAVDNETEAAIQRSMEKITVGRTTIMIAHRLSTVRNADCIYVMENGVITESGRHDALVALGGTYADLWRIQTGEKVG